jgi:AraC-like DNA-binding protein
MPSPCKEVQVSENQTPIAAGETSQEERSVKPVPQARFCVSDVAPRDRFAVWKESISCIFDVELGSDVPREQFDARLDATLFGDLMLARTTSSGQSWTRSESAIARDGMDHYMIQLFVEGGMEAEHRRGNTVVQGRSLVVFDLAQEMSSRTPEFTNLSLILPRDMLAGILNRPDDQHMRTLPAENPVVSLLHDHMVGLQRMKALIPAAQGSHIASATTALVAACLNGCDAGASETPETAVPQTILAKRMIERSLGDSSLSVAAIASAAGISRTRLYALFEPMGGVKGYVRERRLRRALGILLDTRKQYRPIYDVAAECGFVNESAFSRAFRQRFGCSPREARETSAVPIPGRDGETPGQRYEHWLHHLAA